MAVLATLEGLAGALNPKHKKHKKHKGQWTKANNPWTRKHLGHGRPIVMSKNPKRRGKGGAGGFGSPAGIVTAVLAGGAAAYLLNRAHAAISNRYPQVPGPGTLSGAAVGAAGIYGLYKLLNRFAPKYATLAAAGAAGVVGLGLIAPYADPYADKAIAMLTGRSAPGEGAPSAAGLSAIYPQPTLAGLGQSNTDQLVV